MTASERDKTKPVAAPSEPGEGLAKRRPAWIAALVVTAAVMAAYSNTFRSPLVFDDLGSITDNPTIRNLWAIGDVLGTDLPAGTTSRGRPVVNLSLAINYAVSGLDVWSYHLVNVAIHVLAAMVLFGLVRRTLLLPGLAGRFGSAATVLAFATALLWALHPLQTAAVTYVVQRAESLMGLFFLLTLYGLNRGSTSRRPWAWYAASTASCLAGMASKEVMVVAPAVALLYDRIFLARPLRVVLRRRAVFYLALAGTWGLLAIVAWGARGASAGFGAVVSPWAYGGTQLWAIARYLSLIFWPGPLVLDYGSEWVAPFSRLLVPALVVGALLAATGVALWRAPKAGFLGAAFFLILAPTSSILPVVTQTVAEHRMYLPLAAVATLAVVGGYALGRRVLAWSKAPAALGWAVGAAILAAAAGALGLRTFLRNADYHTALAIWEDTVRKRPENPRAYNNAGRELMALDRWPEALRLLDRAIALYPKYVDAYHNRGVCYMALRQFDRAVQDYGRAIAINPNSAEAYHNRGECRRAQKQLPLAMQDYDRAIALRPNYANAYNSRGVCRQDLEEFDGAIQDYGRAIALDGNSAEAYNNRGNCWLALGRLDRAGADYDRAIALRPQWAKAYNNRGVCRLSLGKPDLAMQDCDRAIALDGRYAEAYNNRGNCWRAMGKLDRAMEDYSRAIALDGNYAQAYNNRGVTYNDLSQYDLAVADYDRAIALNPNYAKAYGNRAVAQCNRKHYDEAWADVQQCRRRGFPLREEFLKRLSEVSGRSP